MDEKTEQQAIYVAPFDRTQYGATADEQCVTLRCPGCIRGFCTMDATTYRAWNARCAYQNEEG